MSLLQVFPNCTSVLHRLVFVFVFLLMPFQQHALSVFPSHSLLSACTAPRYPLSQRISITAWFSSPPHLCLSIQLFVRLPVNLLRLCWFLLFLQGAWCDFFQSRKARCQDDGHPLTCCQICHSFLPRTHHHHRHHHQLVSSLPSAIVAVVTVVTFIDIITEIISTFIIFCYRGFPSVALLQPSGEERWQDDKTTDQENQRKNN